MRRAKDDVLTHIITVENKAKFITVSCENILAVGEVSALKVVVSPITCDQEVEYNIYDQEIISISNNEITALKEGFTTVEVISKSDKNVKTKFDVLVQNENEEYYDSNIAYDIQNINGVQLDTTNFQALLNALSTKVMGSLVGVEKYQMEKGKKTMTDFGSGIIYRRDAILKDGTEIKNVTYTDEIEDFSTYRYYIITTRNLVQKTEQVKVYLGENIGSLNANIIEYDDKVDLAVLTIESMHYFATATLGDSSKAEQGEFILSIGNSNGKEYFRTSTFGVISHTKRYISTDTDGDNSSDWDSEYIQHDATINSGDNGGAIINMKGEVIGINSTKIISFLNYIKCMSLAIPSNLVKEIVDMLEVGIKPQRAILGVTMIEVKAFYTNKDKYLLVYPEMKVIPDGLEYGFFISEVTPGGVAYMANVQAGDILLEFNGITTKFSYLLRAELGKFIIGSGEKAYLKVLRNGEILTLEVVF